MPQGFTFQRIDRQLIPEHGHLGQDDFCYFFGEYTAREGYSYSRVNSWISNLKKSPIQKNEPHYHYKAQAIQRAARLLRQIEFDEKRYLWIPVLLQRKRDMPNTMTD